MTVYSGENVAKGEDTTTAVGSANLYSHCGIRYGDSSGKWESVYQKSEKFHS